MNKFCVLLSFLMLPFLSFSQTGKIDSLKKAIEIASVDTNKVKALLKLAGMVRFSNGEEALEYAKDAKRISTQIKWIKGEMKASYMAGVCYYVISDYDNAFEQLDTTILLAAKLKNADVLSKAYELKGALHSQTGNYKKALEYYQKALKAMQGAGIEDGLEYVYNNIGVAFFDSYNYEEAKKFFLKSLPIAISKKDSGLLADIYLNLGSIEEGEKKRSYCLKAIAIAQQINHLYTLIPSYANLASYYTNVDSLPLAIKYRLKTMYLAKEIEDNYSYTVAMKNLGGLYVLTNKMDSALYYLLKSKKLSKELGAKDILKDIYGTLATAYAKKGLYKQAFEYMEQNNFMADTLFNESIAEKNAEFTARFETEEKEKEIIQKNLEISKHKSIQNKTIAISLGLLLFIGLLFQWYFNNQKHKKKEAALALKLSEAEADKLRELDQLKSRFFTNISHELRTPLTLITGPLQQALEKKEGKAMKHDIQLAHSNSKKLLGLINEILDLSKLESGEMVVKSNNFELESWLRRVFYAYESLAGLQHITLDFESTLPKLIIIKTDAGKLEKILNNLLSNAVKYNRPNGNIKFSAAIIEGQLQLKVSDTGNGLSPDELPKIFNRFYQVADEGTPLLGGTGIGLALARELASLLEGDITVESKLGLGTGFLLTIPFEKGEMKRGVPVLEETIEEKTQAIKNYESLLINGEKPQILIVEDNPEMSQYLKTILSENHRCTLANNGKEALGMVERKNYDLIISDVMMPIMDGFEFKNKFNELKGSQYTPFIMLTARALQEDRLTGFKLGVDDYITKPFDKAELIARVHNLLQNKIEREAWRKKEATKEEPALSVEENLLRKAEKIVLKNLDNSSFKVTNLASEMAYSQRQVTRLIKKMTGMTPVGFILELKLQKAYQLIKTKQFHSVTEVMYEIGIESPSYFSAKFTERFGCNPREL